MNSNIDSRMLTSMLKLEENYIINGDYFNSVIKPEMRSKLATWMLEVCEEQECTDEVYATAMNIFDRLMCALTNQVEVYHLQLLGSVCLFIASKLSSTPKLTAVKLIDYTDNSITLEDLLEWELIAMDKLRWDVCSIVPNEFIDIFLQSIHLKHDLNIVKKHCYAFTAMCATDFKFSKYPASLIASACILNAIEGLDLLNNVNNNINRLAYNLYSMTNIEMDCLIMIKDQVSDLFRQSAQNEQTEHKLTELNYEDDYDFNVEYNLEIDSLNMKRSEDMAKNLILSPASSNAGSSSSSLLSPSLFMNSSCYTDQEMASMMMVTPPNANSLPMPEFDCFTQQNKLRRSNRLIRC